MASKAGAGNCEFGPEPGSTIMWFGMHEGKRFDQLPKPYRQFLVERSKENRSSRMLRFKRLSDEYDAWTAAQNHLIPTKSACSTSEDHMKHKLAKETWNQKRKRPLKASSTTKTRTRPADTPLLGTATTSKGNRPAITATGNASAIRTTADTLPKATKRPAESQTPQKPACLVQTHLAFIRTPLSDMTPNKSPQRERQPLKPTKVKTVRNSHEKHGSKSEAKSSQSNKVVDLLSTSKGHTSPSSSFGEKPESGRSRLPVAEAPNCTPSAKRRKTQSQKPEKVAEEVSSSQSSAPSPWRPVVPLSLADI